MRRPTNIDTSMLVIGARDGITLLGDLIARMMVGQEQTQASQAEGPRGSCGRIRSGQHPFQQ
jgi:hypothetical protein